MNNKDFKFPKDQLELLAEYVQKGIAASKQTESQFYGEFRSSMKEVKSNIEGMNKKLEKVNEQLENHDKYLKRTEPVIKAFEENKIFVAGAKKIAKNVVIMGSGISALSATWYLIKHWIINLK